MGRRGRPKKYPDYDPIRVQAELIKRAAILFEEPFDDRFLRDPDLPSMNYVASQLRTSVLRVRKLLITAGCYSTEMSRNVQSMKKAGASNEEIMETMGISRASVNGYLPYEKGAYNVDPQTLYSEQSVRYRKRRESVKRLKEHYGRANEFDYLWDAISAFELYPFRSVCKSENEIVNFTYRIKRNSDGSIGDEMIFSAIEKTVTRATVKLGYRNAVSNRLKEGCVAGPEILGVSDSEIESYLYPVFIRIGVITTDTSRASC